MELVEYCKKFFSFFESAAPRGLILWGRPTKVPAIYD